MLEKQKALLASGKTMLNIIKDAVGDAVDVGMSAFKKFGLRRTGGGVNNPNGVKGDILMLPYGPLLGHFVAEMPKVNGGVEWYKLVCENSKGYLVGIPINRLCESYVADKRDEGDTVPKPTPVSTESPLTQFYVGPTDDVCLQNFCDHLAGHAIKIEDVYQETRLFTDGTSGRGKRWKYDKASDAENPDFRQSMLWVLMNWDEACKSLTPEELKEVEAAAKAAGVDITAIKEAAKAKA